MLAPFEERNCCSVLFKPDQVPVDRDSFTPSWSVGFRCDPCGTEAYGFQSNSEAGRKESILVQLPPEGQLPCALHRRKCLF